MDSTITAIVVDVALNVVSWAGSGLSKKLSDRQRATLAALTGTDAEVLATRISPLQLAAVMPPELSARQVQAAFDRREFAVIVQEMFACAVAERETEKKQDLERSLLSFISTELSLRDAGAAASFGSAVYQHLTEAIEGLLEPARASDPEAWVQLQQTFLLRQVAGTLDSIARHSRLAASRLDDGKMADEEASWIDDFLAQILHAHGFIKLPDLDSNKNVPIDDLYVSPTFHAVGAGQAAGRAMSFHQVASKIDRMVVLGDPGGGKSTFTNRLVVEWARKRSKDAVPFHVVLRNFAPFVGARSILEYIESTTGTKYQAASPEGVVEGLLVSGRALVVFDGLDELVDNSKRRAVTEAVELFSTRYPATQVVVTSRRVGYDQARLDPQSFRSYLLGDFNERDLRQYVEQWFASQPSERDVQEVTDDFIEQSRTVPDLRRNPLMLSLMCIIFRGENFIPRNRPDVYEKCADLLFKRWDGHRLIEFPLRARDHIDGAMKYLAHWMLTSGSERSGVSREQLIDQMTQYLHVRMLRSEDEARNAAEEFVDFCKGRAWVFSDLGSSGDGEPIYTFTHRTFMEYFAAYHLTRTTKSPEALAKTLISRVANEEWDVVAQLAVQLVNKTHDLGSERILQAFVGDRIRRTPENRRRVLAFAARCLSFATVSENLVREVTRQAIAAVRSGKASRPSAKSAWLTLLDSSDLYMAIIEDEHRVAMAHLLSSGEFIDRQQATSMLLFGATRGRAGYMFAGASGDTLRASWALIFHEIAEESIEAFRQTLAARPVLYGPAVQLGLVGAQTAITSMRQAGISAGAVWMSDFQDETFGFDSQPLVEFVVGGCRRAADASASHLATLRTVCRLLLTELIDEDGTAGSIDLEAAAHPRGILVPGIEDDIPAPVRDDADLIGGYVLASLLLAELISPDRKATWLTTETEGPFRELFRVRGGNDNTLGLPPVFDQIAGPCRNLVLRWMSGDVDLLRIGD